MSLVKEAVSAATKSLGRTALESATKAGVGGIAGALAVPAVGAAIYHAKKRTGKKHFEAMTEHAGEEYKGMNVQQKKKAKQVYHAIAKHSPTVAKDPMAAWSHVRHITVNPSTYGAQTIEQLRKVETAGPTFFVR